jgi:hypothetical protein
MSNGNSNSTLLLSRDNRFVAGAIDPGAAYSPSNGSPWPACDYSSGTFVIVASVRSSVPAVSQLCIRHVFDNHRKQRLPGLDEQLVGIGQLNAQACVRGMAKRLVNSSTTYTPV